MKDKFYVPFETAQALKEKGYPQNNHDWYYNSEGRRSIAALNAEDISAPTYHEVVDWLESKDILIDCTCGYEYDTKEKWYRCFTMKLGTRIYDYKTSICVTREEALNAAILKALEMI